MPTPPASEKAAATAAVSAAAATSIQAPTGRPAFEDCLILPLLVGGSGRLSAWVDRSNALPSGLGLDDVQAR